MISIAPELTSKTSHLNLSQIGGFKIRCERGNDGGRGFSIILNCYWFFNFLICLFPFPSLNSWGQMTLEFTYEPIRGCVYTCFTLYSITLEPFSINQCFLLFVLSHHMKKHIKTFSLVILFGLSHYYLFTLVS